MMGVGALPPAQYNEILKICISTELKTYYPHEKCQTYVNKTIFDREWLHSLRNNRYGPLYFLLVPVSFSPL